MSLCLSYVESASQLLQFLIARRRCSPIQTLFFRGGNAKKVQPVNVNRDGLPFTLFKIFFSNGRYLIDMVFLIRFSTYLYGKIKAVTNLHFLIEVYSMVFFRLTLNESLNSVAL